MFWNCDLKNNFFVGGSCFIYRTRDLKKFRYLSLSSSCLINHLSFLFSKLIISSWYLRINFSFSLEPSNAQLQQDPLFQKWHSLKMLIQPHILGFPQGLWFPCSVILAFQLFKCINNIAWCLSRLRHTSQKLKYFEMYPPWCLLWSTISQSRLYETKKFWQSALQWYQVQTYINIKHM
jgi:hypothetical protein